MATATTPSYGTEQQYGTGAGTMTGAGMTGGQYGKVIVTLKSAHNLNDKAWIGKSDPYCVVKVADAEISTHHVKNAGDHCDWSESFAFNNVSPSDFIEFHVYDKNRLMKDAHMGEGTLSLRQVFEDGSLDTRVPLATRSGTKDAGEIWISMRKEDSDMSGMDTGKAGMTGMTGTTTAMGMGSGMESERGAQQVCGEERFAVVEDRPIVKERVTQVLEHHPVEKEFVVETRPAGERAMAGDIEHLGTTERVVQETPAKAPCDI